MFEGEVMNLGTYFSNPEEKVQWSPYNMTLSNPHMMICGGSGSGKTTLLRKIIEFVGQHSQVLVLDFHDDLATEGDEELVFSSNFGELGLSIFEFSKDEKSGGLLNRTIEIVDMFKKSFMQNMGIMQESVLKQLISDVYAKAGIFHDEPETWDRPLPTIEDFGELISDLLLLIKHSESNEYKKHVESILKSAQRIRNMVIDEEDEEKIARADAKLDAKMKAMAEKLMARVKAIKSGSEDEDDLRTGSLLLKYPGIDLNFYSAKSAASSLESLQVYVKTMIDSRVFSQNDPVLSRNTRVHRFNLKHVNERVMFFLSDVIIQRAFRRAMEMPKVENNRPRTFIVIDESKLVMPVGKEKENPFNAINRIVSEARKAGIGIILASQRVAHYSEEMLANINTKVLLRVEKNEYRSVKNKIGIKDDRVFRQLDAMFGCAMVIKGGKENLTALPWIAPRIDRA